MKTVLRLVLQKVETRVREIEADPLKGVVNLVLMLVASMVTVLLASCISASIHYDQDWKIISIQLLIWVISMILSLYNSIVIIVVSCRMMFKNPRK